MLRQDSSLRNAISLHYELIIIIKKVLTGFHTCPRPLHPGQQLLGSPADVVGVGVHSEVGYHPDDGSARLPLLFLLLLVDEVLGHSALSLGILLQLGVLVDRIHEAGLLGLDLKEAELGVGVDLGQEVVLEAPIDDAGKKKMRGKRELFQ